MTYVSSTPLLCLQRFSEWMEKKWEAKVQDKLLKVKMARHSAQLLNHLKSILFN